jgi:hypothetical protein
MHVAQQVAPGAHYANPAAAMAHANALAAAVEQARQLAAIQLQLQATQAGGSPLAANHQLGYITPQASVAANSGAYAPVAGQGRGDLVTLERSLHRGHGCLP